eukprot:m.61652 g.61652  ORF g.61652 m.61652 type:complete len:149 (+) comp17593_c0_seq1:560-1006(+)
MTDSGRCFASPLPLALGVLGTAAASSPTPFIGVGGALVMPSSSVEGSDDADGVGGGGSAGWSLPPSAASAIESAELQHPNWRYPKWPESSSGGHTLKAGCVVQVTRSPSSTEAAVLTDRSPLTHSESLSVDVPRSLSRSAVLTQANGR